MRTTTDNYAHRTSRRRCRHNRNNQSSNKADIQRKLSADDILKYTILNADNINFADVNTLINAVINIIPNIPIITNIPTDRALLHINSNHGNAIHNVGNNHLIKSHLLHINSNNIRHVSINLNMTIRQRTLNNVGNTTRTNRQMRIIRLNSMNIAVVNRNATRIINNIRVIAYGKMATEGSLTIIMDHTYPDRRMFANHKLELDIRIIPHTVMVRRFIDGQANQLVNAYGLYYIIPIMVRRRQRLRANYADSNQIGRAITTVFDSRIQRVNIRGIHVRVNRQVVSHDALTMIVAGVRQ